MAVTVAPEVVVDAPPTVKQILEEAKTRLADPRDWRQHSFYDLDNPKGGSVCTYTALSLAVTGEVKGSHRDPRFREAVSLLTGDREDVCDLNNRSTHDELMAAFDRAIAAA